MQIYGNKRIFLHKKSPTPTGFVWKTNMAAVSLFWKTNMAAVTSCEYAQYVDWQKNAKARGKGWKRLHCSSRFAQSDRAIKELKQWRRRRQRERQKSNRFRLAKQQHLHVHHAFLCISFPSLHDYNVKMPNFTFWRGRENTRQRLSYSFLELRYSLSEFKWLKKLPTFDELNKTE